MVVHVLMEEGVRPFLGAALPWTSLKGGGVHDFSQLYPGGAAGSCS